MATEMLLKKLPVFKIMEKIIFIKNLKLGSKNWEFEILNFKFKQIKFKLKLLKNQKICKISYL